MLRDFELHHGAVLARLIHGDTPVSLTLYPTPSNSSYVINGHIGLYIKYSTKRMTPWNFSFAKAHQDEIKKMKEELGEVFVVLVCESDGLVTLSYEELKKVLDENHEETEWIRVARRPREKYSVSGTDGKLKCKIGENEFPRKILAVRKAEGSFMDKLRKKF